MDIEAAAGRCIPSFEEINSASAYRHICATCPQPTNHACCGDKRWCEVTENSRAACSVRVIRYSCPVIMGWPSIRLRSRRVAATPCRPTVALLAT